MPAKPLRYDGVAIAFHWSIAALVLSNIVIAWSLDLFDEHTPIHQQLMTIHKSIGTTVLGLVLFRLAWRWTHPVPSWPDLPEWQRRASALVHGLLYLCLFVMPLTGLVDSAAFAQPVDYFFIGSLPTFIAKNEPLGHAAFAVHETTALVLYVLVLVHAGAALFHHYAVKDGVLRRMLPAQLKN